MAQRPVAIGRRSGYVAAALILALLGVPLLAIFLRAGGGVLPGPSDWAALRFTLTQASLSAVFSVVLALPVARALARRRFPGRRLMVALTGAPFILPVVVAVMGLLAIFGARGLLNGVAAHFGLGPWRIYGLHGVVLAHVFFNMPLAVRMILQGWQAIPSERFRLAAQLDLPPRQVFRLLEWPMLRQVLPGAMAAIFAICLASFAVALILGGGPRATTVELAIYQAFLFDFDLGRAAVLALMQTSLVAVAAILALLVTRMDGSGTGLDRALPRWDSPGGWRRLADGAGLALAGVFLIGPLLAVAVAGLSGLGDLPSGLWPAIGNSVVVSLLSALSTVVVALALSAAMSRVVQGIGLLPLALSPLVLGTGYFLILNPVIAPGRLALPVTVLVNTLMALPFSLRVLAPAYLRVEADFGRLADTLALRGLSRLRWLLLPRLRAPLGFAAGLAGALSMGDLGVITLFGSEDRQTLPLLMYRLMGAYRSEAAASCGLILMGLSFGIFWLFDRGGGKSHA
ncbi:thiamine/thiamine pyrophosphate ABC transporter permease ThiP [Pseudooceanicola spongiae]|uniref:ABC transporter permease subunit n=1 Tax=Pseudooceanicola spongiae TaxID=2613965 RepID=A0A7L9WP59_9RHOB|nr:thiamine/thiamine pyrophosphate ABC transporter permease ThiP [Pseudooceanicola spongiae]QOL82175.1 ABC transporter permease subunit [Pseudooceanicola spongiae]